MSKIRPDIIYPLNLPNHNLELSPAHDSIHVFKWLGTMVIKYFDQDEGTMKNVWLPDSATSLFIPLGFVVSERDFITESEHEQYIDVMSETIRDEDFGITED